MAVAPRDLLALTPEDEVAIVKFEKVLDEKLAANFVPGTKSTFNLSNVSSIVAHRLTYKMRSELVARYEKVGWMVTVEPGPGGDDFITFIVAEAVRSNPVPEDSVEQMLDKMAQAKAHPPEPGSRPPVVTPMHREDPENPYGRSKLASK